MTYLAIDNNVNIDKSIIASSEPFDSKVKYAAVTMPNGEKYLKGAPDIIMNGCTSYIDNEGNKKPLTNAIMARLKETWKHRQSVQCV